MDIKKLQATLLSKGIRIKDDDPVFVLVALNEIVLEDMTRKYLQAPLEARAKQAPIFHAPKMQTSFALTATTNLVVLTVAAIAFATGMFFGHREVSALLQGSIGLALGVVAGASLCFALYARFERQYAHDSSWNGIATGDIPLPIQNVKPWTEAEILHIATKLKMPNETKLACLDVFIGGLSIADAAKRHGIHSLRIARGKRDLESLREQ